MKNYYPSLLVTTYKVFSLSILIRFFYSIPIEYIKPLIFHFRLHLITAHHFRREIMYSKALVLLSFAIGLASGQSLDNDDFPSECSNSCGPIASASDTCDQQFDNDDQELNCICTSDNIQNSLSNCLGCVEPYRNSDNDFDDAYDGTSSRLASTFKQFCTHCSSI